MTQPPTPEAQGSDLIAELRSSAAAFREHDIFTQDGDPVRLTVQADEMERAAEVIDALERQAVEQRMRAMTAETDLIKLRRASSPVAGTDPSSRRAAAKKLLCDICACAAETGPASMDLPHVIEGCVQPLETLIWERDAMLYLTKQFGKYRDGHDIMDAIAEMAAANNRAQSAESLTLSLRAENERLTKAAKVLRDVVPYVMKALMETGSRDNLLLADRLHRADADVRAALAQQGEKT